MEQTLLYKGKQNAVVTKVKDLGKYIRAKYNNGKIFCAPAHLFENVRVLSVEEQPEQEIRNEIKKLWGYDVKIS